MAQDRHGSLAATTTITGHGHGSHKRNKHTGLPTYARQRLLQLRSWFATQSFVPGWLPSSLRYRLIGYGVAVIAEIAAAMIVFQFVALFPTFAVRGALLLFVMVLVALEFGAGPSVVATALGGFLLDFLLLPPYASLSLTKGASLAGVAIFFVAGFLLVHLASQRERSRRAARTAMEIMEEFMSIASHELRAPLASAMMGVDLAEQQLRSVHRLTTDDPAGMQIIVASAELLGETREQLMRQQRLIADLLDVARIQSGGFTLNLRASDVPGLVVEAVREMHRLETSHPITVQLPETPVGSVLADSDRLRQVLLNYLMNAMRYAPAASPIHVRVSTNDASLVVAVRDEGPGVPVSQQPHIWERFQRAADASPSAGYSAGLGLGLYISRNIIERHGGTVGLESSPGHGATFWFALPLAAPSQPHMAANVVD